MTIEIKALGEGQLPTAATTLYVVPSGLKAIIKTITLVNADVATGAANVNLYLKTAATSRRIIPTSCSIPYAYLLETDSEYTLEAGDSIEGDSSVASAIDYTISGVEKS